MLSYTVLGCRFPKEDMAELAVAANAPAPRAVVALRREMLLSETLGRGEALKLGDSFAPSAGGEEEGEFATRVGLESEVGALRMESIEKEAGLTEELEEFVLTSVGCFVKGSGECGVDTTGIIGG